MLSYGRVAGQLSRISRHAHAKNISEPYKRFDVISIHCLKYSSKTKKPKATGTTAKVEDCVPKTKSYKKVPPVPPLPPPPPPPHANVPPTPPPTITKPLQSSQAPCDNWNYSCPPNCPPNHEPVTPQSPGGKDSGFQYWKQLIAAFILAGVSAIAYSKINSEDDKKRKIDKVFKRTAVVQNPRSSNGIPAEIPYLLIGGGTAAFSAFRTIKANDPTAKILIITSEPDQPYMRPPLSKELWYNREEDGTLSQTLEFKQWNGSKRSLFFEHPDFYTKIDEISSSEKGGLAIATGWTVKKIDPMNKTVYLHDDYPIKYDKCLIATGATPKSIPVFDEANLKNNKIQKKVTAYRTKEDFLELSHNMSKPETNSVVIIGGGFLGSELSTSLARHRPYEHQKIHQVFKEKHILAQVLPEYLSEWATERIEEEGVNCIPNVEVHSCTLTKDDRLSLQLTNGKILEADQVIIAVGVEVEDDLAKASNLELDPTRGGYLVNAELEARNNLWVAGDAACFYDVQLGRRRVEHHDHAVVSGKLAGENMTGARKPYLHQSMFWSDLGAKIGFEALGITDSSLETVGVFADQTEEPEIEQKTASIEEVKKDNEPPAQSNPAEKPAPVASEVDSSKKAKSKSEETLTDYEKGVVFYLRDNVVVGILLWNIFNRLPLARQLLARGTKREELDEASKLFEIHEVEF